jgi:hypothetical protein
MHQTFAARALATRVRILRDGRRVTLRHTVPSDAPRLGLAFSASREPMWGCDLLALDDHGAVVGHAGSQAQIVVAGGWAGSGLEQLLIDELIET